MKQSKMPLKNYRQVHFVGIKGVGMTPLAIIAKEAGIKVTGSDIEDEFITDWALKKVGITPFVGFSKDNIGNPDLVITTGAHGGFDNPEVKAAKDKGIRVLTQGEAVGFFMKNKFGISVAGSHGKTTVTAMLSTILVKNNLDPSYVVGTGNINQTWLPGHKGKGRYFVTEADEYANEPQYDKKAKFLLQHPKVILMTNIEFDHPDLFRDIGAIRNAFLKFIQKLPKDGVLVACGDDVEVGKLLPEISCKVVTYGRGPKNDFVLTNISQNNERTFFRVEGLPAGRQGKVSLGEFMISVPGVHNALNAVGAIVVCMELGLSVDKIRQALPYFTGTKRRFEFIGKLNNVLLYDDYAHHPTEIKATLKTAKTIFPKRKIIVVFQPHTYSRTKALFREFIHAFGDAHEIAITNIYPSLREKVDESVSSEKLVNQMLKLYRDVRFLPEFDDVLRYLALKINKEREAIIVTLGAGNIYQIWTKIY